MAYLTRNPTGEKGFIAHKIQPVSGDFDDNEFPRMKDVLASFDYIIKGLKGTTSWNPQNWSAAMKIRLNFLRDGISGKAVNENRVGERYLDSPTPPSINRKIADYMDDMCIFEFPEVETDKRAFLLSLLVFAVRQALVQRNEQSATLKRLLVVEESHSLLAAEGRSSPKDGEISVGSDLQNMLLLLLRVARNYGCSVAISDQLPTTLSKEVMGLTRAKVAFRLDSGGPDNTMIRDALGLSDAASLGQLQNNVAYVGTPQPKPPRRAEFPIATRVGRVARQEYSQTGFDNWGAKDPKLQLEARLGELASAAQYETNSMRLLDETVSSCQDAIERQTGRRLALDSRHICWIVRRLTGVDPLRSAVLRTRLAQDLNYVRS